MWEPIRLSGVTVNAGGSYILPRRPPSPISRNHMIEVQLLRLENLTAILAGKVVALKNVIARKAHLLDWKAVEFTQHEYARDTDT